MHTTNYENMFIEVADDCPVTIAEEPPQKDNEKTVARLQYDLIKNNPYKYTSDDIIFTVFAIRSEIPKSKYPEKREAFFSKGQACMRSSPLAKRYGWGIHYNQDKKIAIYAVESQKYKDCLRDKNLEHKKAMRNKKK